MAATQGKSGIMAKYGARAAKVLADHAADPIDYGFRKLPAGLRGEARVTKCYFDKYKPDTTMKQADGSSAVGEDYLRMEASIEVITEGDDTVIGQSTSVMIPICSKGIKWGAGILDLDACLVKAQNELKKCGGMEMDYSDLDAAAAAIEEARPRILFTTTLVKAKNPNQEDRVFENWHGSEGVNQDVTADAAAGTDDGSASGDDATSADADGAIAAIATETDLAVLVQQAGDPAEAEVGNDTVEYAARARLTALAQEAGVDQDGIDNAADWQALADLVEAASNPEPEPPADPKKGDVRKYKLGKSVVQVEVLSSVPRTKTVTLKNLTTGKPIVGADKKTPVAVKWADLLPA